MEKTSVDRLQPGIFISLSSVGWLNHPFIANEFCISNEKQIRALDAKFNQLKFKLSRS